MQARPDLGRHQRRQALEHEGRRRDNWNDVTKNIRTAGVGRVHADLAVARSTRGTAYVAVDVPPDGRPQAVHLQDDRLRRDVEEDHRQHPDRPSARLRAVVSGNPNKRGMLFAGTGHALLLLDGRRRALDAVQGRPAAGAGELDHRRAALPRRRRLDLRPRALHPAEHHAARADRPADGAGAGDAKLFEPRAGLPAGAQRVRRQPAALQLAPAAPDRADEDGDPRRGRQGRAHAERAGSRRGSTASTGICCYDAPKLVELRTTPPREPAHLGRGAVQGPRHAPHHALGHHAADRHADGGAGQVHRCASPSTARRSRSRSR